MSEFINRSNKEYGSVFKNWRIGGPIQINTGSGRVLPQWSDFRFPGSTDSNMGAAEIISHWTPQQTRRFQLFMDSNYKGGEPWRKAWMDRTTNDYEKGKEKIVKTRIEIMRRLIRINVYGPQSMEDWCLLFLWTDNQLDIPSTLTELVDNVTPNWARPKRENQLTHKWYTDGVGTETEYFIRRRDMWNKPSKTLSETPANPRMVQVSRHQDNEELGRSLPYPVLFPQSRRRGEIRRERFGNSGDKEAYGIRYAENPPNPYRYF